MWVVTPSSLPGEKCMPSNINLFLYKYTYMIVNSDRNHGPSQFMNHSLNCEAGGMGCFDLFYFTFSKTNLWKKMMCIIILQMTRLKCFELAPGVHSTSLGAVYAPLLHYRHLLWREKPRISRTVLKSNLLFSRFKVIFMKLLAKIIWLNLTQKVPYLPPFPCKNHLVPFSPVTMCKLTNNTPSGHHIWTIRKLR